MAIRDRLFNFLAIVAGWCALGLLIYHLSNVPEPWEHQASKQSLAEWCENRLQVLMGKDPTDSEIVSCLVANPIPKSGTAVPVKED